MFWTLGIYKNLIDDKKSSNNCIYADDEALKPSTNEHNFFTA